VIKDSHGFIWITTRAGLCRYDGYNVKVFQYDPADSTSLSDNRITRIACILEDKGGAIWIGTVNGLNRFDHVTNSFTRYINIPYQSGSISDNWIYCLHEDRNGTLWIGAGQGGGLNRFDAVNNTFESFTPVLNDTSLGIPVILSLMEDRKGTFWVGTTKGLFIFDRKEEFFSQVDIAPDCRDLLNHPKCITIHEDTDGTIVVGTPEGFIFYDTVTNFLRPYPHLFHKNLPNRHSDFLPTTGDSKYTHWIISIAGLYGFNKHDSTLARVKPDPNDPFSISGNALKSIFKDESGNALDTRRIWCEYYGSCPKKDHKSSW